MVKIKVNEVIANINKNKHMNIFVPKEIFIAEENISKWVRE